MLQALSTHIGFSRYFIEILLKRSADLEEDLCDQPFNQSEKRLARTLIKLAHLRQAESLAEVAIPGVSHEVLVEMVGTTRARVSKFMYKFKKMKLIDYGGSYIHNEPLLLVRTALLEKTVLRSAADRG